MAHALLLEAQRHHGIHPLESPFQTTFHPDAAPLGNRVHALTRWRSLHEIRKGIRQQAGRAAEHHIRAAGGESPEVGAGHPRMEDVSDDQDSLALQRFRHGVPGIEVARQGVEVEQPLAWMAVQTITTVEHNGAFTGQLEIPGELPRHPGRAMAHHKNIRPHRHIGPRRVQHALSLAEGTAGGREALHIR